MGEAPPLSKMDFVELPYVSPRVAESFQRRRNILIKGFVDRDLAIRFMLVLKDMEEESRDDPIWVIIDSPGGEVQAGWEIVDSMQLCAAPVHTVCYGEASSIAAVIFASGKRGQRHMLRHARLMVHQPWTDVGVGVRQSDLIGKADDLTDTRNEIEDALSKASGLPLPEVHRMCEEDYRMGAGEAIRLGFADNVL